MKVIAMIPARFDSERLPGKLMMDLGGEPIILRTYKNALNSKLFDLKINHKDSFVSSNSKVFNKKTKRKIKEKWKEMYKSVEKLKGQKDNQMSSSLSKIEQNLREIKNLRYQDKISADEYKRRKQKLLDEL